jgi:hypothetical protein
MGKSSRAEEQQSGRCCSFDARCESESAVLLLYCSAVLEAEGLLMPVTLPTLPPPIAAAVKPVFDALPLDQAMAQLVVEDNPPAELIAIVERIVYAPAIAERPTLAAGLWLYIDDLDRSHRISQSIDDPTGSFWHGIMHRREGDFGNSHYWLRRVGEHPAFTKIEVAGGYDGHAFIDEAAEAHRRGETRDALVQKQRAEWAGLFAWCAGE